MARKNIFWMKHLELEFGTHIWWFCATHECFQTCEYEAVTPSQLEDRAHFRFCSSTFWREKVDGWVSVIVSSAVLTYAGKIYAGKDQTLQKYAGKPWNTALIRRKSIRMIRKYAGKIYAGKYPNRKKYAGIPSIPAYNTPEKDTMIRDSVSESANHLRTCWELRNAMYQSVFVKPIHWDQYRYASYIETRLLLHVIRLIACTNISLDQNERNRKATKFKVVWLTFRLIGEPMCQRSFTKET